MHFLRRYWTTIQQGTWIGLWVALFLVEKVL